MNNVEIWVLRKLRDEAADKRDSAGDKARAEDRCPFGLDPHPSDSPEVAKLREQVQILQQELRRDRITYFHKGKAEACDEFVGSLNEVIRVAEKDLND